MSMTYAQMVFTMMYQAQRGSDAAQFANLDTQGIAETLIPTIFQQAGEEAAKDERKRSILKRSKTVAFTNGSATLSDDVLTMYLEDSTFFDTSDLSKTYSWVRNWNDFIDSTLDPRLGYYCVSNGVAIVQREPGALYAVGSGVTANRSLNIPCVPEIPASASSTVDVPEEIISDILLIGSELLRGALLKAVSDAVRV